MDPQGLEYIELYLDSSDGTTYNPAYSSTDWPLFYLNRKLTNVAALKIIQAEIPFTYYTINSLNNTFTLTESGGGGDATVTIPVGTYTISSLQTALNTALTAASPNTRTYTSTYSTSTQKLTITVSSGTFTLTFVGYSPYLALGMSTGANASTGTSLVSPNIPLVTGPNYVYVNSDTLGSLVDTYVPQRGVNFATGLKGPQIAKIPMDCNFGGISFYNDPVHDIWFNVENLMNIQNLDLYLTYSLDQPEKALRLNGVPFTVKLGVLLYPPTYAQNRRNLAFPGLRTTVG